MSHFHPHHLIVEGDSACVICWGSNTSNTPWYLADLFEEVIELSSSLNVSFQHINRMVNDRADMLAKEGFIDLNYLFLLRLNGYMLSVLGGLGSFFKAMDPF